MQRLFRYSEFIAYMLVISMFSCKEELHPLTPPKDPVTSCQAPSIEKNIIGTWNFESNYNKGNVVTTGTVTFDQKGNIIDPDSLFENQLDLGPVVSKTYKPKSPNYQGSVFEVYQFTKEGKKQITYFTLVSNECKLIHLSLIGSAGNKVGFVLTK